MMPVTTTATRAALHHTVARAQEQESWRERERELERDQEQERERERERCGRSVTRNSLSPLYFWETREIRGARLRLLVSRVSSWRFENDRVMVDGVLKESKRV